MVIGAQFTRECNVSLCRQLVDGARTRLQYEMVDELLLHFGRQHRLPDNLPPRRHWTGELLKEMLDAAVTAAEVVEKQASHDAPTQSGPPGQRGVGVVGADDAFADKMVHLTA